jgi:hypothetical protein
MAGATGRPRGGHGWEPAAPNKDRTEGTAGRPGGGGGATVRERDPPPDPAGGWGRARRRGAGRGPPALARQGYTPGSDEADCFGGEVEAAKRGIS